MSSTPAAGIHTIKDDLSPQGRSALKLGLELGAKLGVNPYQFGFTGTTDTHTALATSREENYCGKYKATEPGPDRHNTPVIPSDDPSLQILTSQEAASGLTAVWARENTREAIFDSLMRKEVYSTTATRIRVRVFAGWDFETEDMADHDFVSQGYGRGVPMGGELASAPQADAHSSRAPRFMVRALRDPDGANLDHLRRGFLRYRSSEKCSCDGAGPRLYLADLVLRRVLIPGMIDLSRRDLDWTVRRSATRSLCMAERRARRSRHSWAGHAVANRRLQ